MLVADACGLMATMREYAPEGRKLTGEELLTYTLNASRLVDMCVQAVEHAFAVAGTSATVEGHPLERCFRDIHMLSTHNVYRIDQIAERWALAHFGLPA
jgi:alkylation response protein AidB-like acyl-CoA dehydrogenase